MLENQFKTNLVRELKERFPGCIVLHIDPNEIQGIPGLLILYRDRWAALEGKRSLNAPHRPNQDYYVNLTFNDHSCLRGQHAFLSASKYNWINYDPDKLAVVYTNFMATQKGTELHEFAAKCIELGQKLPRSKKTLNNYVNDAIGFRMTPEQVLYYSDNCFGTADAICFRDDILRIHDLKTGAIPAHMEQLLIYDALFCLEYRIKPEKIQIENRIYQSDDILIANPCPDDINPIMDKIREFDPIIAKLRMGVC